MEQYVRDALAQIVALVVAALVGLGVGVVAYYLWGWGGAPLAMFNLGVTSVLYLAWAWVWAGRA